MLTDQTVQEVGLWPSDMVRLVPHWHAVKWSGIMAFAICTIGYLYLQSIYHRKCTLQATI